MRERQSTKEETIRSDQVTRGPDITAHEPEAGHNSGQSIDSLCCSRGN